MIRRLLYCYLLLLGTVTKVYAQTYADLKAATFFNVLKHIEWNNSHKDGKFTIGVLDSEGSTYEHISKLYHRERLPNIPGKIRVKQLSDKTLNRAYNVVYICSEEIQNLAQFRQKLLQPQRTLIVSENAALFAQGTAINLELYRKGWGFRYNEKALQALNLASKPILQRLSIDAQRAEQEALLQAVESKAKQEQEALKLKIKQLEGYQDLNQWAQKDLLGFLVNLTEELDLEQELKDSLLHILEEKKQIQTLEQEHKIAVQKNKDLQERANNAQKNATQNQQKVKRQRTIIWIILFGFTSLLSATLYYHTRQQKHSIKRERESKQRISNQKKNLEDNIQAAKTIQDAMLPSQAFISKYLPEYLIYFRPRDIVSGDFYWFTHKGKRCYFAAVDCTGHGVQGAFTSMMVNEMLHKIIYLKNIYEPGDILTELHLDIRKALKQAETGNTDGVDIALCAIEPQGEAWQIAFAGAKNPLIYIQAGEIKQLSPSVFSIGGFQQGKNRQFNTQYLHTDQATTFYIFSDGYQDQLGGKHRRRIGKKRFQQLLLELHQKDYQAQSQDLDHFLEKWLEPEKVPQLDDLLILSWRLAKPPTSLIN